MGHMLFNDHGGKLSLAVPTGVEYGAVLILRDGHTSKMGDIGVQIVLCSSSQDACEIA